MHITGVSRLSTLIQRKSELHSPLHFGGTTAQSTFLQVMHVYHAPGLARSWCEVMTSQRYRHIGAVGSHLNYPQTEYGAPTGSSARDRASRKTHFESRLHVDLAIKSNFYFCVTCIHNQPEKAYETQ